MIARLRGVLDSVASDSIILDVGGVGYLIFCSGRTQARLPVPGQTATLHIETHVREDHIHLYGFADERERDWFRLLTTVQGVGTRVALSILSVLGPDELADTIMAQDKTALTRADGVGPKLAGRIISELKDKTGSLSSGAAPASQAGGSATGPGKPATGTAAEDAISALVNLGYGRTEAYGAVKAAQAALGDAPLASVIPRALKELSQ